MLIKKLSLLAAFTLSGCAVIAPINDMLGIDDIASLDEPTQATQNIQNGSPLAVNASFQNQFRHSFQQQNQLKSVAELKKQLQNQNITHYDINHYVRGLMQDLVANLQYVNATTPVAVVSFVMLDSDYNDANLLGIQIAESLIHEVHKFGIPVIDFKAMGFIRVTEQGDFAFSKDYEDLTSEMPARYIVGGTMLKHTDGYLINARIVGVKSQVVVASAQSFIPNAVSDPILMMTAATNTRALSNKVEIGSLTSALTTDAALSKTNNSVTLIQQ